MFAATAVPSSSSPPIWFFVPCFIGTWVLVSFAISRTSGWSLLSKVYPAQNPFSGTVIRFQAAAFRKGSNYNGCLNFGGDVAGLYMVPMLIFRAFHKPLMIPWDDIWARPVKLWKIMNFVELRFRQAPDIPVRIKPSLAAKLVEASVGRLSITPSAPVDF